MRNWLLRKYQMAVRSEIYFVSFDSDDELDKLKLNINMTNLESRSLNISDNFYIYSVEIKLND